MPATIFAGSKVKTLKDTLTLNGLSDIISLNVDPSVGAGVAAPIGSIALHRTTGVIYQKTGAADTGWVIASSTGALNTAGGTMTGNITFNNGFGSLTQAGLVAGNLIKISQFITGTAATFTPNAATRLIFVQLWGGGGGGAGVQTSIAGSIEIGSGGGGGGYQAFIYSNMNGLTATYTVGAGGAGGASGAGSNGGTTSWTMDGYTRSSTGGAGGAAGTQGSGARVSSSGGSGGTFTASGAVSGKYSGVETISGTKGGEGFGIVFAGGSVFAGTDYVVFVQGHGGGSYGSNNMFVTTTTAANSGVNADGYSKGGNGANVYNSTTAFVGGNGSGGKIMVYEYA